MAGPTGEADATGRAGLQQRLGAQTRRPGLTRERGADDPGGGRGALRRLGVEHRPQPGLGLGTLAGTVRFWRRQEVSFKAVIERIHPDDRETVEREVRHALANRSDYVGEFRAVLPDGSLRWIASRGRGYADANGTPIRMVGAAIDITERRQSEAALLRQRSELAHLSRVAMLGELSGSMAHELNQPLTAILSNAQAAQRFLAAEEADLGEVRDILMDIVSEDKRAGEIIRRLRLLLRKGELQQQPLDVNEVVQEVLKLVRSDLVNQNVAVQTELEPGLPVVHGDRVQLQQVLLNLVMNGCEAMAGTEKNARQLTIRTDRSEDGSVRISVADCGPGIAPEKLEQIFESFYTTKPHGMGLGLTVCRTIVTAHHGKLWATSKPGQGATVWLALPVGEKGRGAGDEGQGAGDEGRGTREGAIR